MGHSKFLHACSLSIFVHVYRQISHYHRLLAQFWDSFKAIRVILRKIKSF